MNLFRKVLCLLMTITILSTCSSFFTSADTMSDEEWQKVLEELGIDESGNAVVDSDSTAKTDDEIIQKPKEDGRKNRLPYMNEYLTQFPEIVGEKTVHLNVSEAKITGGNNVLRNNVLGNPDKSIYWDDSVEACSWTVSPSKGRYVVYVYYTTVDDNGTNPTRTLTIDGKSPYSELIGIPFKRLWVTDGDIRTDSNGDQVRPDVTEKQVWQTSALYDSVGYYSSPLILYFDGNSHTITLENVLQDMALGWIELRPYNETSSYSDASARYSSIKKGRFIDAQAEDTMTTRNDATIRIEANGDPATQPNSYGYKVFNCIGGYRWRVGGQSVNFEIDVPEDGLYSLAFRYIENWNDGIPSYRTIAIDGEIPFKELEAYRFEFTNEWKTEILSDDTDNPYLFYLKKGTHVLTLTATLGEFTKVVQTLYDSINLLSDIVMDITKLTGTEPDSNYDYQFFKYLPNTKTDMETLISDLSGLCTDVRIICGCETSFESTLNSVRKQIEAMVKNPFSIARRYSQLTDAQTTLGNWYLTSQEQPLLLDRIFLSGDSNEIPILRSTIWQKIKSTIVNFAVSFSKDYNNVGSIFGKDTEIKESITVWIARGTEWAEIIKGLADEDFTPKTGIAVNINTVPSSQLNTGSANVLLLSVISGKAPDIAMGVAASSPVEFAIRNTVVDISKFSDYDEVSNRFFNEILTPLKYNGGVFALPETMNFQALFYRTDVVKEYNITLPNNRDELYSKTLPQLYRNGMQYYQPQAVTPFLYQNGGSYYTKDGRRSALDSYEAYTAFKEYTEMFTQYGCPVNASFFNRFRSGEMPVGIGGYSFYIQLSTSAPELAGKWAIAPIPGKLKEDGTIDRTTDGMSAECDIMLAKGNENKYIACWDFLKWWSSDTLQEKYSREIEALQGVQSRWNTANINAFFNLAWGKADIEVIREQFKWMRETPVVLGGYYTSRHVLNAFTSIVVSGNTSVRDSLEDAVDKIDRELKTKQEEYGIFIEESD